MPRFLPPTIPDIAGSGSASSSRAAVSNKNEVFIEHDEFIGDLLRKLKGDGDDSDLQDPFVGAEDVVEKYPTYDPSTHWRSQLPELGQKFESATQLKECLTYYALANGYSIWYERSASDKVIAVCGQRPPNLKDPDLGKQRKQFRYPCEIPEDVPKWLELLSDMDKEILNQN